MTRRPPGVPSRRPVAQQRDALQKGPCLRGGKDHATKDCSDPEKQQRRPIASFATAVSFMSGETADGATTADDSLPEPHVSGDSHAAAWPVFETPPTADGALKVPLVLSAHRSGSHYEGLGLGDCGTTDSLSGAMAAEALMHKPRQCFGLPAVGVDVTAGNNRRRSTSRAGTVAKVELHQGKNCFPP